MDSDKDPKENLYGYTGQDTYFGSNIGIVGLSNTYLINSSSYVKFNVVTTLQTNKIDVNQVDINFNPVKITPYYGNKSYTGRLAANIIYHKKYSAKDNIHAGIFGDLYDILLIDSIDKGNGFYYIRNFKGQTFCYSRILIGSISLPINLHSIPALTISNCF